MRMRWILLAALLAACKRPDPQTDAAVSLESPATATLFLKAAPVVGAKRRESSELSMTVAMTVDGGRSIVSVSEVVKRTEEILAVSGNAITKAKVTFDSVQSTQPSTIAGKTFVVEAKNGNLEVRDARDLPVSNAEAKEVEKHLKNLGKPDPMVAALPVDGVVAGQKVEGVARVITDQLKDSGDGMTVDDVVVSFKERRGDDGVFDVALKLTKDEGLTKMTIAVKGDVWVSTKTSSTTRMDLSGPVTIAGGPDGTGTMSMKLDAKGL